MGSFRIDGIRIGTRLDGSPIIAYWGEWTCDDGFVHRMGEPGYDITHPEQLDSPGVREALHMGPDDTSLPANLTDDDMRAAVQAGAAAILADQETKPRPSRALAP